MSEPYRILHSAVAVALLLLICISSEGAETLNRAFDSEWRFARGARPGAEAPGFDDSRWDQVQLPHDWAIAGPYEPNGDPHTGKLPWRGEGWYRKVFELPPGAAGKQVYLDFDGAMASPKVYVNGKAAGGWDYGYMSFRVDITSLVAAGKTNLVAVHLDTRNHQSRWYPGAGLYRKVRLSICEPLHVARWGVFASTPMVSSTQATVQVQTTLESHSGKSQLVTLVTEILAPDGKRVAHHQTNLTAIPNGSLNTVVLCSVRNPKLWDISSPRLYSVKTRVYAGRGLVDSITTPFGIRTFEFKADDGFHLNSKRVQLKGVNLHHDHGPLGAAFFTRAMERQLQIMKDMGANAIRTSHNPPAPELLDLCDRMGFVVWNEAFDKWDGTSGRSPSVPILDYNLKQIRNFVLRDRNHPSVVVWSAGNEIWELEGLKIPRSVELLRDMVNAFKELDSTRPVALAHCVPESAHTALDDSLDVTGWNYSRRYAISREKRPNLPIIYSESASALSTRGHYELPHPLKKDDFSTSLRLTSYDHNAASWADLADTEFALMERDSFVAGEFVWTGFDYIGEPTPYIARGWGAYTNKAIMPAQESRISLFGIVDIAGIPKDRFYLYRSYWNEQAPTVHVLPHWNWPERLGESVPVYVYTSGDSAELFLNGKSMGKKQKDPSATNVIDRYRIRWEDIRYEPGEVKAVAYKAGTRIGADSVKTAGTPTGVRLTLDRKRIRAGGDDLCYALVEAVDGQGNVCPLATNTVHFTAKGPIRIAGVANGDHHFPAEFVSDKVDLFYGKAVVVLRSTIAPGTAELRAAIPNMEPASAKVRIAR